MNKLTQLVEKMVTEWSKPPKILVIEDNVTDLYLMEVALRERGCVVDSIQTVKDATAKIDAIVSKQEEAPQMALVDLALTNGDTLAIIMKLRVEFPSLPIAIVTGSKTIDTVPKLGTIIKEAVCAIIEKPLSSDSVEQLLSSHQLQSKPAPCKT